jgi:hypothetical protein
MTSADFKALFPEFSSSTYDTRIATLLGLLPALDADRFGNQLTLALGYWVADKLAAQDMAIKYGVAATSASSSSSTEKKVGEVSVKSSLSQAQSKGTVVGRTTYGARYEGLLRQYGLGQVALG